MAVVLNQLGQVSLSVEDVDAAEEFYGQKLGLRKLYRFGDLVFFDCAGVRLFWRSRGRSRSYRTDPSSTFGRRTSPLQSVSFRRKVYRSSTSRI